MKPPPEAYKLSPQASQLPPARPLLGKLRGWERIGVEAWAQRPAARIAVARIFVPTMRMAKTPSCIGGLYLPKVAQADSRRNMEERIGVDRSEEHTSELQS